MTSKQRAQLKSIATNTKPIFQIGKGGINENMTLSIIDALFSHELIKISVLRSCDYSASELAKLLELKTGAETVCVIGAKIVLYKRSDKDGIKHIEL